MDTDLPNPVKCLSTKDSSRLNEMHDSSIDAGTVGTRIRERRIALGLRQVELARLVGISPSYLNLIEHNRRRIGGRLLGDLAARLEVEVSVLSEGAEAALLAGLRNAVEEFADLGEPTPELGHVEEFAGRFPGWAALLDILHRRVRRLEHVADTLSDRLTHDPNLSASLHEVLSTVTAIRSTADILADTEEIDANWRSRFNKNIQQEAHRLSEGTRALAAYLDNAPDADRGLTSPQEEIENWLETRGYHIDELEQDGDADALAATIPLSSEAARNRVRNYLSAYRKDAQQLPLHVLGKAIRATGYDPIRLAEHLSASLPLVLRRIATLPDDGHTPEIGRVACNASGMLSFRKPLPGFRMPRFGAACPLWPLYRALMQPSVPLYAVLEQAGSAPRRFVAYAHAQARLAGAADGPLIADAQMVVIPAETIRDGSVPAPLRVGQSCRVCPTVDCMARREDSILAG